jgi:integrase
MARPRYEVPEAKKRRHGNETFQIAWWADKWYAVATGTADEREAEACRLEIGLALRGRPWPAWAADAPAVKRYTLACTGEVPPTDSAGILSAYETTLRAEVAPRWAQVSLGHLRELADVAGKPLADVSAADADAFLAHIIGSPGTHRKGNGPRGKATRNRALAACRRFYRWTVRTGRLTRNPFATIKALPEVEPAEIIYLTRPERDTVLAAAKSLQDGAAVWLAVLAGLRLGEVGHCRWEDVLQGGRLRVGTSKTHRPRLIPLHKALMARLMEIRPKDAQGRIVLWPEEAAQAQWQARLLLNRLHAACTDIPKDRVRWNSFRHTFGSLAAQAGVSLDKISAWMGNSPAVCRRHYAEFCPRDRRDNEIDRI